MSRRNRLSNACHRARLIPAFALLPLSAFADQALHLEPTVVTATSTVRQLGDAPASVSVISRDELALRPVQDLEDALRGTAGLQFTGVGMTRRGVSIRGMGSEHTLVLIDGQRIGNAGGAVAHADFDLGWVPVEAIERIEVVRGPMSSLYGSEALGGVVTSSPAAALMPGRERRSSTAEREDGRGGQTHQLGVYTGGPLVPGVIGLSLTGETRRRQETPCTGIRICPRSKVETPKAQAQRSAGHRTRHNASTSDLQAARKIVGAIPAVQAAHRSTMNPVIASSASGCRLRTVEIGSKPPCAPIATHWSATIATPTGSSQLRRARSSPTT